MCRALYTYQNPDNGDGSKKISESTLDTVGITSTTFCQILDYIYTSVIVLNDDTIQVNVTRFKENEIWFDVFTKSMMAVFTWASIYQKAGAMYMHVI